MAHTQLPTPPRSHRRAPARDDRHRDARLRQQLQSQSVTHVEYLERLSPRTIVEPPVGQYPVDIEYQKAHSGGDFGHGDRGRGAHTTPARKRSCTLSAPTRCPCSSATGSAVMRCTSMRCTASAARSWGEIVFPGEVITSLMLAAWMSVLRSSARRRSPSVNTPRIRLP